MNSKTEITIQVPLEIARYYAKINPNDRANIENKLTKTRKKIDFFGYIYQ